MKDDENEKYKKYKERSSAIVIKKEGDKYKLLVIFRRNEKGKEFVTFPGGHPKTKGEKAETLEDAVCRETSEETSVEIKIGELLYQHIFDVDPDQYYYFGIYQKGEPKLKENTKELKKMKDSDGKIVYDPRWVDLDEIKELLLYPLEIRESLETRFEEGFKEGLIKIHIKDSELKKEDTLLKDPWGKYRESIKESIELRLKSENKINTEINRGVKLK